MQVRRIVTDFPKAEAAPFAFTYADTATFEEEIDEWFSYNEAEYKRLLRANDTFVRRWKKFAGIPWLEAEQRQRESFVEREINGLLATDLRRRCKSLQTILHIILGVWDETAGMKPGESPTTPYKLDKGKGRAVEPEEDSNSKAPSTGFSATDTAKRKTNATKYQLEHMKFGILLVARAGGIPLLYEVMQNAFQRLW
jgi:hypothetical protein